MRNPRVFLLHIGVVVNVGALASIAAGEVKNQDRWLGLNVQESQVILKGHKDAVEHIAFLPRGERLISYSSDSTIRIWDVANGSETQQIVLPEGIAPIRVAFSPDCRTAAVAAGPRLLILDTNTGKILSEYEASERGEKFHSAAFASAGRILVTGHEWRPGTRFTTWDIEKNEILRRFHVALGQEFKVAVRWGLACAVSPDDRLIAGASGHPDDPEDTRITVWNMESGGEVCKFLGHEDVVLGLAFTPDGRNVISGGLDKSVLLWDVESGMQIRKFDGVSEEVLRVAVSPNGKLVASSGPGRVRLWCFETGEPVSALKRDNDVFVALAISPDSRRVAVGDMGGLVRIWSLPSLKQAE